VKVEFRRSFERDVDKIRDEDLLDRIKTTIESVEAATSLLDVNDITKLKTRGNYYRIRIGDYRIGITVNEDLVSFVRVLHRREIYRYFP
jgi:mRNA interferase RelE/StbE